MTKKSYLYDRLEFEIDVFYHKKKFVSNWNFTTEYVKIGQNFKFFQVFYLPWLSNMYENILH